MTDDKVKNKWKGISGEWNGVEGYLAQTSSGVVVKMGKDTEGRPGASPMELLLVGLAGCTMMDVIDILRKKRQIPVKFTTFVRGNQRVDRYPYRFTEYSVEYHLWGRELQRKDVEQAITLSEEKYCSVGGTLSKAGPIKSVLFIHTDDIPE